MDDLPQIFKLFAALLLVLSLMGGLAFLLKKLGLSGAKEMRGKDRRLKLVESLPLDTRRRLVIVQCDDKQHLVILGANGETVVDSDLKPAAVAEHDPKTE